MVKNVTVTFEFNSETDQVTNVNCFVDGVEKKKTTTRTTKKKQDNETEPYVRLESNKYVLNDKAIELMEVIPGESRISIQYEKDGTNKIPVIGSDIAWNSEGIGNKLAKAQSVACRGKQNTILADFGTEFLIEPHKKKDGLFIMISGNKPITNDIPLEEVIKESETTEIDVLVEGEDNEEITEMTYKIQ